MTTKRKRRPQRRHRINGTFVPFDIFDFRPQAGWGGVPESWNCIDCGFNTAPGLRNRAECERIVRALGKRWENSTASIRQRVGTDSEVYTVHEKVWKKARVPPWGGCLCIGCLEKRLRRRLKPEDFDQHHTFSRFPGTPRLLNRRGLRWDGTAQSKRAQRWKLRANLLAPIRLEGRHYRVVGGLSFNLST